MHLLVGTGLSRLDRRVEDEWTFLVNEGSEGGRDFRFDWRDQFLMLMLIHLRCHNKGRLTHPHLLYQLLNHSYIVGILLRQYLLTLLLGSVSFKFDVSYALL